MIGKDTTMSPDSCGETCYWIITNFLGHHFLTLILAHRLLYSFCTSFGWLFLYLYARFTRFVKSLLGVVLGNGVWRVTSSNSDLVQSHSMPKGKGGWVSAPPPPFGVLPSPPRQNFGVLRFRGGGEGRTKRARSPQFLLKEFFKVVTPLHIFHELCGCSWHTFYSSGCSSWHTFYELSGLAGIHLKS